MAAEFTGTDASEGDDFTLNTAAFPDGALSGVRVLDCTQILSGPYAGALLGDLGADVIKVERPRGGDDVRSAGTVSIAGSSPQFHAVNRNKRSLALDIRTGDGRTLFLDLVAGADVVLENFRPGVMDRLGLGYNALKARNPGIIYCSITGFGEDGPSSDRPGFDLVAQGATGLMSMTGSEDGELAKIGVPLTDLGAGMLACIAILSALHERTRTGLGQRVATSLLRAGLAFTVTETAYLWATGQVANPNGSAHRVLAPYQLVRAGDGPMLLACGNDRSFARLCTTIGKPELIADERFRDNGGRVAHRRELISALEDVLITKSAAEWIDALNRAGCPCGPVNTIAEALEDPQAIHSKLTTHADHPVAGPIRQLAPPFTMDRTPARVRVGAPDLGQHSRAILGSLGLGAKEIDQLIADGTVHAAD
ncbi:CoA transferase [Acrocarpospora macrocephala]|uniref:CoA transferase n=1 Tax=Acrocarpospora macrocephala TaxID=150177 RepID=A0A5M3WJL1_9ACTN|nr:CoA transferase [Acrocarpospora macrocephala]GES09395.1 CoA transferase [Acrocarpospora macrocephala]